MAMAKTISLMGCTTKHILRMIVHQSASRCRAVEEVRRWLASTTTVRMTFVTAYLVHLVSRFRGHSIRRALLATSSQEALVVLAQQEVAAYAHILQTTIVTRKGGQPAVMTMAKTHAPRVLDHLCVMSTVLLDTMVTVADLRITIVFMVGGPSAARTTDVALRKHLRARLRTTAQTFGPVGTSVILVSRFMLQ